MSRDGVSKLTVSPVLQAYASGCDVVILGSDFERLQIIPGAKHGNIQVGCVDCSLQGGQVRGHTCVCVCVCVCMCVCVRDCV